MNTPIRLRPLTAIIGLVAACSVASCGGSSGGTSFTGGDFLIADASVDDLLAFSVTVDELRLIDTMAVPTGNLLPGSVDIEFLSLQGIGAWLASLNLPQGTYTSVQVTFQPGSATARATDGSIVAVTEVGNVLTANFLPNLVVGPSGYNRVLIDLNLLDSISGDVTMPPISFDPSGGTSVSDGSTGFEIDEIKGTVASVDIAGSSFVINAFVDDDLVVPLGQITVTVDPSAVLIRENEAVFPDLASFLAVLIPAATFLEVHGDVGAAGAVVAKRIEVEDQTAGVGSAGIVKIEGRITSITLGTSFDLQLVEIEKGSSIADPVLAGMGNPSTITVSYDAMTVFVNELHAPTTDATLALGQKAKVKFGTFLGSPFPGFFVEIETQPDFDAFVQDVTGVPNSITVRLKAGELAITAGQVLNAMTDVTVDLTAANLFLDVENDPAIAASLIQPGLRIDVRGQISGAPTAPTIAASRVKVRGGRFKGVVSSINAGLLIFDAAVSSENDPFATNVSTPPYMVVIDPAAVFEDDASTMSEFFALFNNLMPGEVLDVEVDGVGSGNANEVLAFEIKARVN